MLVSVTLAASAPLISKQIQNSNVTNLQINRLMQRIEQLENQTAVPVGAVMFFDLEDCPDGWDPIDNVWNGRFPRFAGNYTVCNNQGETAAGACVDGTDSVVITTNAHGSLKGDAVRSTTGRFVSAARTGTYGVNGIFEVIYKSKWGLDGGGGTADEQWIDFDISRAMPVDSEIRPKSVALLGCRKNPDE